MDLKPRSLLGVETEHIKMDSLKEEGQKKTDHICQSCTDQYDEEATEDDDSCEYEDTMFSDFEDWQLALGAVVLVLLLK